MVRTQDSGLRTAFVSCPTIRSISPTEKQEDFAQQCAAVNLDKEKDDSSKPDKTDKDEAPGKDGNTERRLNEMRIILKKS